MEKIKARRSSKHNEGTGKILDLKPGTMVFLKKDKTKLKSRKPHMITKAYMKNEEEWATIQKSDSQFRAKEYEVKQSELIPLPDQSTPNKQAKPVEIEDEIDLQHIELLKTNAIKTLAKLMKITMKSCYNSPIDYERFKKEVEEDDDVISVPVTTNTTESVSSRNETSSESSQFNTSNEGEEDYYYSDPDSTVPNTESSTEGDSSSTIHDSDDELPATPFNTPEDNNGKEYCLNHNELITALRSTIEDLEEYNSGHPTYPPNGTRRSTRNSHIASYKQFFRVYPKRK